MQNFLDELNRNAKTESEIVQENILRKQQEALNTERINVQKQKAFEEFLLRCLPEIKEVCLSAVKKSCYITYDHKRYIVCELSLKHHFKYDPDFSAGHHECWIDFSCYKLTKSHILESKKQYKHFSKELYFDCSKLQEFGLESMSWPSTHYSAPTFVDLKCFAKENIEGYKDVSVIPKKIVYINYPPNNDTYGYSFTETLREVRFLIEF